MAGRRVSAQALREAAAREPEVTAEERTRGVPMSLRQRSILLLKRHPRLRELYARLWPAAELLWRSLRQGRSLRRLAAVLPQRLAASPAVQRRLLRALRRRDIRRVALYNDNAAAQALIPLLRGGGVEVSHVITPAGEPYPICGCPVYSTLRRDLPRVDAVLVTAPAGDPGRAFADARRARRDLCDPVYPVFELLAPLPPRRQGAHNYMYCRDLDPALYPQELQRWYRRRTGRDLDLRHPRTFSEKMQWMKLYGITPLKTRLTDKILVKEWVAARIGQRYVLPNYALFDSCAAVDFEPLPPRFVMKCNHGCQMNIFVGSKHRADLPLLRRLLEGWMSVNFAFANGFELQYAAIRRRILVERRLPRLHDYPALAYRFWCFGGEPLYIEIIYNKDHVPHLAYYDLCWVRQPFNRDFHYADSRLRRPGNLDEMTELARVLCADFDHVRVDFYRLPDGQLFFSELTFTTASGICRWTDPRIDLELGEHLQLSAPQPALPGIPLPSELP